MKIKRQRDGTDCGVCSLASVIEFYGGFVSLEQLRLDTKATVGGTTALNLLLTAEKYGFDTKGIKTNTLEDIHMLPAIAHLNCKNGLQHYVVIYKITKDKVVLMDPAKGKVIKERKDFLSEWSGNVLLFYPKRKITILKQDNSLFNICGRILFSEKRLVFYIVILSAFLTILTIAGGYYFQVMANAMEIGRDEVFLKILVVVFLGVIIFKLIFSYLRGYLECYLNKNVDALINHNFLNHLFNLPLDVITSRKAGEIATRVSELSSIKSLVTDILIAGTLDFGLMIVVVPLLWGINKKLFLILFLTVVLYILEGILSSKKIFRKVYQNIEYEAEFNNEVLEDVKMINSIKNLDLSNERLDSLEKNLGRYLYDNFKLEKFLNNETIGKSVIKELCIFVINTWGFLLIYRGNLSIINLITFNTLLDFFFNPLQNLVGALPKYNYLKATIVKINDFLSVAQEELGENVLLERNDIVLENLNYSYNKYKNVLENVSMNISGGEVIAIDGDSGCGKSTLCNILDKFILDYEGNVLIGGINIKDLSIKTVRNVVLYVNQQEMLFSGTIKDNIVLNREVSMEEFMKVANICGLEEIVANKAMRYDTFVDADGCSLSGGERQRVILARALLKKFNILILDEALSEVDLKLEEKIIRNMKKAFKGKTIIYITHKKNHKLFDRVITLGVKK